MTRLTGGSGPNLWRNPECLFLPNAHLATPKFYEPSSGAYPEPDHILFTLHSPCPSQAHVTGLHSGKSLPNGLRAPSRVPSGTSSHGSLSPITALVCLQPWVPSRLTETRSQSPHHTPGGPVRSGADSLPPLLTPLQPLQPLGWCSQSLPGGGLCKCTSLRYPGSEACRPYWTPTPVEHRHSTASKMLAWPPLHTLALLSEISLLKLTITWYP